MLEISKKLSYILRHNNENMEIDSKGFMNISDILKYLNISKEQLESIVKTDDKNRYEIKNDKIRARQGHSNQKVTDFDFIKIIPKGFLFHGTKKQYLDSILKKGLIPMKRKYVHLSADLETAEKNADRRKGESVILLINAPKMKNDIFISSNNVYLTEYVNPEFIKVL